MSGHEHAPGAELRGVQTAEDAPLAAVAEHIQGEHMLPDPGRGQDNLLRLLLRPDAFAGAPGYLLLEGMLQSRGLEFVLAEKDELAAVFRSEEIGQVVVAYAFGAGRGQQDAVDMSKARRVIPEYGTGEDVPLSAV
jgi:hypothetical protein